MCFGFSEAGAYAILGWLKRNLEAVSQYIGAW